MDKSLAFNNKRFGWLDYDKGISIILVSYRHCYESLLNSGVPLYRYPFLEYINIFLFGFRMPLFFIASGIFISQSIEKKGFDNYISTRMQTILYPLMVWGVIQLSLQLIFTKYTNSNLGFLDFINLFIDPRQTGQFWYLNTLFFVGVIYSILKVKFKASMIFQLSMGLILYCSLAAIRNAGIYLGALMDIFQYYLFFTFGDIIANFMKSEKSKNILSSYKILIMMIPIFLITQYNFTKLNLINHSNYYVEHKMPLFFLFVAIVGCFLSVNISYILKELNSLKFLRTIGFHSIHIYCMQIIAMAFSRAIFIKIFGIDSTLLLVFLTLIAGILIPILMYKLFTKYQIWWLFTYKKPGIPIPDNLKAKTISLN